MILAWLIPIVNWTIRLWAVWAVPRRRSPNAARAWLLLILLLPIVGFVLYSIFGRAYLPVQRRKRQARATALIESARERGVFADGVEVDAARQATAALAFRLGSFPVVGGNRAELIDDYAGFVDRLVADIDAARESVHLLFYIVEPDATGRRVADAVARARARGAICRVLMDGMASAPGLKKLAPGLRAAGVEVLSLLSPGTFRTRRDLRNHRKIAVIDGRIGYTGSQNLVDAYDYKGRGLTNEELMVRVEGPVVRQLQAIFLTDRFLETGKGFEGESPFPEQAAAGTVRARRSLPVRRTRRRTTSAPSCRCSTGPGSGSW